jgi:hypothetical protein
MIIWGGIANGPAYLDSGGLYDPVGNSWAVTSTAAGTPAGRYFPIPTAVWTGSRMIIWGGQGNVVFDTGGQYFFLSLYVRN